MISTEIKDAISDLECAHDMLIESKEFSEDFNAEILTMAHDSIEKAIHLLRVFRIAKAAATPKTP